MVHIERCEKRRQNIEKGQELPRKNSVTPIYKLLKNRPARKNFKVGLYLEEVRSKAEETQAERRAGGR